MMMAKKDYRFEGMYDQIVICERGQCVEDRKAIKKMKRISLELIKLARSAHSMRPSEIEAKIGNLVKDVFFEGLDYG